MTVNACLANRKWILLIAMDVESSVLIATHCTIVPALSNPESPAFSLDFNNSHSVLSNSDRNWDHFGEENAVDICEVQFDVFSDRRSSLYYWPLSIAVIDPGRAGLTTSPLFSTPVSSFSPWPSSPVSHSGPRAQVRCLSLFTAPFRSPSPSDNANTTHGCILVVGYSNHCKSSLLSVLHAPMP